MRAIIYNTIKTTVSSIDYIASLFAPSQCLGCGREGSILCSLCLSTAGSQVSPRCAGCKKLTNNSKTCATCRQWLLARSVYVATTYDGIYERMLHSYKFIVQRQAAGPIATIMTSVVAKSDFDIICPLPSAPSRIRQRGFDHASLLARSFCRQSKYPYYAALGRSSNVRQVGSNRTQRLKQMSGVFYVKDRAKIKDKNILLLDDVMTTGASIAAATKALKIAGAKSVSAVVFAQKI